jgi:hypothetical protein
MAAHLARPGANAEAARAALNGVKKNESLAGSSFVIILLMSLDDIWPMVLEAGALCTRAPPQIYSHNINMLQNLADHMRKNLKHFLSLPG